MVGVQIGSVDQVVGRGFSLNRRISGTELLKIYLWLGQERRYRRSQIQALSPKKSGAPVQSLDSDGKKTLLKAKGPTAAGA